MSLQIKPEYPCSMGDLYSIGETVWTNFGNKLTDFTNYKALYVAATKTTALAALDAAKAMPDDVARSATAETMRVGLVKQGDICLLNFTKLKGYIETAFTDSDVWGIQFGAAGGDYYREASNADWEKMNMLNQSMKNYINLNSTLLQGVAPNLNMPVAFIAQQIADMTSFSAKYLAFKNAEETAPATAAKINANNACYRTMMQLMRDGQRIYAKDEANRSLFVFSTLWSMINPSIAGVNGSVLDSISFLPIENVVMTAQMSGAPAVVINVDSNGDFGEQLPTGDYVLTISALGYNTQTINVSCKLTGLKRVNVELVKQ